MNSSETSRVERAKQGLLDSIGGRLYLAFGAIILLTVITTVLGLYSFNRFGDVVQRTTTQTIPLVVGAKNLAERSLSLAASAQSIALARDKSELQVTMADLDIGSLGGGFDICTVDSCPCIKDFFAHMLCHV